MKFTLPVMVMFLMPFVANAGDWFFGYRGWGLYSPGGGEWFMQLGTFADVPITARNCVLGMILLVVGGVIYIWARRVSGEFLAEPCAAPNGGPATSVENSNAPGGPPSVS